VGSGSGSISAFAFIAWVNLFSEYGIYENVVVGSVAGVLFLGIALFVGTWLPVRRWRAEMRDNSDIDPAG
jgi:hypothetical protein